METEEILVAIQEAAKTIATPNWAAIASVVLSLLAVIVAGFVAWRQIEISRKQADISEQQNKIALFEKRYELYQLAKECMSMADFLETYQYCSPNEFYKCVFSSFDKIILENQDIGKDRANYAINDIADRLYQSEFLFSAEISSYIFLLAENFRDFSFLEYFPQPNEEFQKTKEHYCEMVNMLESNEILSRMKLELQPILTR